MKRYLLLLPLLYVPAKFIAQRDTVSEKISKIPYKHVDALAKFTQGDFKAYIAKKLEYNHHVEQSINGEIVLLMSIGADGGVSHTNVLKHLSPLIDPEVVRIVNTSPKWQPANLNGQSTSMDMVLVIDIAINGSKTNPPIKTEVKKAQVMQTPPAVTPILKKPDATFVAKKVSNPAAKTPATLIVKKATSPPAKKPQPIIVKNAPTVAKKTVPTPVKKPIPVIAKKVIPPPAKKPVPPPVKKPIPVIAKKVIPPPAKKPVLPPVKKPEPVIAKKVIPPPAKKPVPPPVKKPEPVIAKKVIPPPAKKPVPPPVKKPEPVIAKKVIPPPVKKPVPPPVKKPEPVIAKKVIPPAKKPEPLIVKKVDPPVVKKPKRVTVHQDLFRDNSNNARFPGGLPAFFKYLSANISYPPNSKAAGIQGRVNLSFVVEVDGTINDVEILGAPADDLGQEAVRVLLASPKWKPGIQNGKPVPVSFQIPITFTLVDNKATNP